ncbi:hypothetical protein D9M73_113800 [compost metagenome]
MSANIGSKTEAMHRPCGRDDETGRFYRPGFAINEGFAGPLRHKQQLHQRVVDMRRNFESELPQPLGYAFMMHHIDPRLFDIRAI